MAKFNIREFAREAEQERKKVTWPTRKETTLTTVMVFVMVFVCAIFLFLVDQVLRLGVTTILGLGG
jgi:preprotein translocase subunit SecE